MTCEQIEPGLWRLTFPEPEAVFIINVLANLGRDYQQDVAQLPPALRTYWQGTLFSGKPGDAADLKESQEMLSDARADLRSERLILVENWISEFELAEKQDPWTVEISSAERDEFVSMINDRRLHLALEIGISDTDMETKLDKISDEKRRAIIWEIDVLGHFIMATLGPQIYHP